MYKWNPEDYNSNSSNQYKWALALIGEIDLKGNEKILDIGCGDGKITAFLASCVPEGSVLGIDLSPEMVEYAQKKFPHSHHPNLNFQKGDASSLNFESEFDWAVSFSCLHWDIDHKSVLEGIKKSLNPGGNIKAVFPLTEEIDAAVKNFAKSSAGKKWHNYFDGFALPFALYEAYEYQKLIESCGLKAGKVERKEMKMIFEGEEGLIGFVRSTLKPVPDRIPEPLRQEFIADFARQYVESHPPDSEGLVYLPCDLLEFEATKV